MKAKVIATGEIVMVEECGYDYTCNSKIFRDKNGNKYLSYDLEFVSNTYTTPKKIDWEQRRFELVNSALNGMLANSRYVETAYNKAEKEKVEVEFIVAFNAARYADAVIAKLKEG